MDSRNVCSSASILKSKKKKRKEEELSVKVVYISSPMKVKTSASQFKSLVQHLTGRHSDIHRIMETNGTTDFEVFPDHLFDDEPSFNHFVMDSRRDESPTSESLTETLDEQLQEMFPLDLFLNLNSSDLENDVLASY